MVFASLKGPEGMVWRKSVNIPSIHPTGEDVILRVKRYIGVLQKKYQVVFLDSTVKSTVALTQTYITVLDAY